MGFPAPDVIRNIDAIVGILGTTKPSLWPFMESTGVLISGISVGDLIPSETAGAAEALEDDFAPFKHPSGLYSYHLHPTGDHHLAGIDHANYSFGNATIDGAMSLGAWILPNAVASNVIISKYDSAGAKEEFRFWLDAAGKPSLELHDASASASETAEGDSALAIGRSYFVVITYDGGQAAPVIKVYVNGKLSNNGASTESGSYVAMEATSAPLLVGAGGVTATPTTEFHGRIGLPFLTGKELSLNDVLALNNIYRELLGY